MQSQLPAVLQPFAASPRAALWKVSKFIMQNSAQLLVLQLALQKQMLSGAWNLSEFIEIAPIPKSS